MQRSPDIHRNGGNPNYQAVVAGREGGVDRQGSTMNAFMAKHVIPELLAMGRVGVYVDNDQYIGQTLADRKGKHPYFVKYCAENILNWRYNPANPHELIAVLLQEHYEEVNAYKLSMGVKTRYRYIVRDDNGDVVVQVFDDTGITISYSRQQTAFPFILSQLSQSLLRVTSHYQIALLNLCSSDMYYAWAMNFPIYTEMIDPLGFARLRETRTPEEDRAAKEALYPGGVQNEYKNATPTTPTPNELKIKVGTATGRLYAQGTERPAFIHPSTEPLKVSMEKEEQLKREIRQLTALAITQLEPMRQASAESRAFDNLGLEAGMSFIAQELEHIETQFANAFMSYFTDKKQATIKYPEKYNLRSDEDRREEAKQLKELHQAVPSRTFFKEISKEIVNAMFKDKRSDDTLKAIYKEIDDSKVPTADPDILRSDHEAGLVSDRTASIGRGYDEDEYEQAAQDHAKRLARINAAQMDDAAARGIKDQSGNPDAPKDEKRLSQDGNKDRSGRGPENIKPKD